MNCVLYRLEGCPYCERVVDQFNQLNLEFDSVWVEGMHSKRNEVKEVSGQREVPVLLDRKNGVTLSESEPIMEYIDINYSD